MNETVSVPVADLLLDTENARLGEEQPSQPAVYLSLAAQQGRRLVSLARDIVEHGLDPTTLPAVVATGDQHRRYVVVEGNRRILALKALETPTVVSGALSASDYKVLLGLSTRYQQKPIYQITCVLFSNRADADHWVDLRHTGANEGAGLVVWESNEVDRYRARRGGGAKRTLGGQALDFIDRIDGQGSSKGILTNLDRLMKSPAIRKGVGLDKDGAELVALFPLEEVAKGLRRILDDLRSGRVKVNEIYYESDRVDYLKTFGSEYLPAPAEALPQAVPLADLEPGKPVPKPRPKPAPKAKSRSKSAQRTSLIPSTCRLNPQVPRINRIYNELLTLNVDTYPNAASVMLRVFLELSVDHFIENEKLPNKNNAKLYEKLKQVSQHLFDTGKIPEGLRKAIDRIANSSGTVIAASTVTFNQYVHNSYVLPKPSELYLQWDELQPFMERVWE